MDFSEMISALEDSLYAYDIKGFSEKFTLLIDKIEVIYSQVNPSDRPELETMIARIFEAYQKKDYRLALEVAKYEVGTRMRYCNE